MHVLSLLPTSNTGEECGVSQPEEGTQLPEGPRDAPDEAQPGAHEADVHASLATETDLMRASVAAACLRASPESVSPTDTRAGAMTLAVVLT